MIIKRLKLPWNQFGGIYFISFQVGMQLFWLPLSGSKYPWVIKPPPFPNISNVSVILLVQIGQCFIVYDKSFQKISRRLNMLQNQLSVNWISFLVGIQPFWQPSWQILHNQLFIIYEMGGLLWTFLAPQQIFRSGFDGQN